MEVHVSIAAEELFSIGPVGVTNSMLTMFLVMAFILAVFILIARSLKPIPGRKQAFAEMIVEALMGLAIGSGGKTLGRRVFPLVAGLFIFILFANYSGLLPGVGTIGMWEESEHAASSESHSEEVVPGTEATPAEGAMTYTIAAVGHDAQSVKPAAAAEGEKVLVPFFRPPTADLNMTLALSLVTFMTVQILGIRAHGVGGRIKHMANPPFLFPIELISEFSRIISLSARLFGNVFAGEVLLGVMYAIAAKTAIVVLPLLVPVVFLGLELMFGTIQALVFALLTLIYIALAAAHEHDVHDEEHAAEAQPAAAH